MSKDAPRTEIRELTDPGELQEMVDLLQNVWGTSAPIVNFEILTAVSHSGGYVAAAFTPAAATPSDATPAEIRSEDRDERDDDSEFRGAVRGEATTGLESSQIRSEGRGERDDGSEFRGEVGGEATTGLESSQIRSEGRGERDDGSEFRGEVRGGVGVGVGDRVMVGASLGFLARHGGRPAVHSHVTGLVPAARGTGLGRELKLHQREWALDHGIDVITWTFDPLVRRNAWFNIAVLGADVDEYLPSFYGVMHDAINAGDESDRLHVVWDLTTPVPTSPRDGSDVPDPLLIPTPDDIVALRRTDPAAVTRWRTETREALTAAMGLGRPIVGFTRDGNYVIGSTS